MNVRQGSDAQRLQCRAPWLLSARSNSFFEAKGDYATRLAPNSAKTHEVKIRDEDETSCISDVFFDCAAYSQSFREITNDPGCHSMTPEIQ